MLHGEIMIVHETKKILQQNHQFAKKMFGQNFLIEENILKKIIEQGEVSSSDCVIEIGPGLGTLTEFLAIHSKHVLCYEIDSDMIAILNQTLSSYSNITIVHQDILKVDIKKDIDTYFPKNSKIKVISNLPYYITTPILFRLLQIPSISLMLFMVQKELGERMSGKPKTKEYNALSVLMNYYATCSIVHRVSRNCFYPVPNVESVLLLVLPKQNDYSVNNEPHFTKFVQNIFSKRRKTLINNITSYYPFSKEEITQVLLTLHFPKEVRSEELTLEDILKVYQQLFFNMK